MSSQNPITSGNSDDEVVGVPWDVFLQYFKDNWKPGQHVAIVAPTGSGKSTTAVGILGLRKYVLALDPKGGDDTLAASGYARIPSWPPPPEIRDDIADGKPARLILGAKGETPENLAVQFRKALDDTLSEGGWTVYIDEFQLAADRKMMNLGTAAEKLLVSARYKKVSVVTAFQAPSWVPQAATRQASWIFTFPTKDEDCIKRIAEKSGRDKKTMIQIVHSMPQFYVLVVPPDNQSAMIMTKADKVS